MFGAIIAAIGAIITSVIGANSAKSQQNFQEQMSSTAHQREVKDLQYAGLNPILSTGGSGASTPSGTMFTPDNPVKGLGEFMLSRDINKKQTALLDQQEKVALSQRLLNSAEAQREVSQDTVNEAQATKLHFDTLKTIQDTNQSSAQSRNIDADTVLKKYQGWEAEKTKGIYKGPIGPAIPYMHELRKLFP